MEPNNIEKQIKEKLDGRTIQPSAQAWDRLDAMLAVAENEKPKRSYGWLHIAASFLGFILTGTIFFSQTEEIMDVRKNEVVIENKSIEKSSDKPNIEEIKQVRPMDSNSESDVVLADSKYTTKKIKVSKTTDVVSRSQFSNEKSIAANSIVNEKIEQKAIESKSNDVNVDELLVSVEKSSENEISNKKTAIKVDARSLLSQVDGELELSFREKVIKTVGNNYKTVKVAVINRNLHE
jgi:hypothetical protein